MVDLHTLKSRSERLSMCSTWTHKINRKQISIPKPRLCITSSLMTCSSLMSKMDEKTDIQEALHQRFQPLENTVNTVLNISNIICIGALCGARIIAVQSEDCWIVETYVGFFMNWYCQESSTRMVQIGSRVSLYGNPGAYLYYFYLDYNTDV